MTLCFEIFNKSILETIEYCARKRSPSGSSTPSITLPQALRATCSSETKSGSPHSSEELILRITIMAFQTYLTYYLTIFSIHTSQYTT